MRQRKRQKQAEERNKAELHHRIEEVQEQIAETIAAAEEEIELLEIEKDNLVTEVEQLHWDLKAFKLYIEQMSGDSHVEVKIATKSSEPLLDPKVILSTDDIAHYRTLDAQDFLLFDATTYRLVFATFSDCCETNIGSKKRRQLFEDLKRCRPPIHRHACTQKGYCGGFGYRAGYDKGKSYGVYVPKKNAKEDKLFRFSQTCVELIKAQEELVLRRLGERLRDRKEVIDSINMPYINETSACNFLLTIDYAVGPHFDADVSKAYAWGTWHEIHESGCTNSGTSCQEKWFFFFPEYQIKIRLRENTFICWDSPNVQHGTVLDATIVADGCKSLACSAITQVKEALMYRVLAAQAREQRYNN